MSGEQPETLEDDRIVITPTLVRVHPLPKVWVYGDLSKTDKVEEMIGIGIERMQRSESPLDSSSK